MLNHDPNTFVQGDVQNGILGANVRTRASYSLDTPTERRDVTVHLCQISYISTKFYKIAAV